MPQPACESSSRNSWSISLPGAGAQHRVGPHLGGEARRQARAHHRTQQLGGAALVDDEVVVVEEEIARGQSGELRQNLIGPAMTHHAGELGGHRAELAVIGAPPLGHGGLDLQVLVSLDQGEVGDREALELGLRAT